MLMKGPKTPFMHDIRLKILKLHINKVLQVGKKNVDIVPNDKWLGARCVIVARFRG